MDLKRIERKFRFKRFGKVVFICGKERPLMFFLGISTKTYCGFLSQSPAHHFSIKFTLETLQFLGFSTAEKKQNTFHVRLKTCHKNHLITFVSNF
jgi:hypothetical protein